MDQQPQNDGGVLPSDKRILVNEYHGTPVQPQNRGVEACETLWNRETQVGSFDDLIYVQLENANIRNDRKITIVDIGSGEGNLFKDFLAKPQLGKKTRQFLKQHPDFHIEMIGITDAKSEQAFLTETEIVAQGDSLPDNSQIRARNIQYTLTYNQRLTNVLHEKGVDNIDLCTSTLALTYLGPNVFNNTLEDILAHLSVGGQMIAYDYDGLGTGIVQPHGMMLALDIRNINDDPVSSLQSTLKEAGIRFFRRGTNIEDEEAQLEKAEDFMIRIGIRTEDDIKVRRARFQQDLQDTSDKLGALVRRAASLSADENDIISRHTNRLRKIKEGILMTFYNKHQNQIVGTHNRSTIFFKKIG